MKGEVMKGAIAVILSSMLATTTFPLTSSGAQACPAEVTQAKAALARAQASVKKSPQIAKGQDIQAPRSQAGAKSQDIQAPRSQDIQAPKSQEIQAPRSQQDIQAPRSQDIQAPKSQEIQAPRSQQDIQAPRSQEIQAPRVNKAAALVREADAACKKGDMAAATQKAREALALLK
jgi:hypothetical protein